jgi:hypothetical protein
MNVTELEDARHDLIEKRQNLINYGLVWAFVLFFCLIIPRILRRITPTLFLAGLVVISVVLTVSGLLLLARLIGIQAEIREINAEMKHAKAKRNLEDVVAHYEVGDDGELIEKKQQVD